MILEKNFSNIKIILVEPNGPLNVGSVARLCSNFEVEELRKRNIIAETDLNKKSKAMNIEVRILTKQEIDARTKSQSKIAFSRLSKILHCSRNF